MGRIVGLLLICSAFIPIGPYHSEGGTDLSGFLWNFMLPTGWFGLIAGISLLFHEKIGLREKRLNYAVFGAGLILVALRMLNVDYFIGLCSGAKGLEFDVEGYGFLLTFFVALITMFASFFLLAIPTPYPSEGKPRS